MAEFLQQHISETPEACQFCKNNLQELISEQQKMNLSLSHAGTGSADEAALRQNGSQELFQKSEGGNPPGLPFSAISSFPLVDGFKILPYNIQGKTMPCCGANPSASPVRERAAR